MKSSSFRKLRLRRLKAMMYSFLDLGAFLLQGKKIQESAIQFLVKFVRFGLFRLICFRKL
ncbi:hypothetical protein VCRA2128O305_120045 [Vibrio crassostreae]|nr:hypothetical protein VCRA2118O236_110045 [Vibrio crassostreae]CAK1714402.1 hypothetical protein VCRA2113O138_110044 [Vibrio crassostreae]CAK1727093.1 hypothetical protein VCRA2113O220_120044 [Vibrio crassostreae]CAK1727194.1 hypothetical protein VCRA2110O180_120044 [Vibrio crassostreae]CAK1727455.1 hypothetical protein VCRA2110O181_120044 [Vibrio crassostreae]